MLITNLEFTLVYLKSYALDSCSEFERVDEVAQTHSFPVLYSRTSAVGIQWWMMGSVELVRDIYFGLGVVGRNFSSFFKTLASSY